MHLVTGTLILPSPVWSLWPNRAKQQKKAYNSLPSTYTHPVKVLRPDFHKKINESMQSGKQLCLIPTKTLLGTISKPAHPQCFSQPFLLCSAHDLSSPASGQIFDIGIQSTADIFQLLSCLLIAVFILPKAQDPFPMAHVLSAWMWLFEAHAGVPHCLIWSWIAKLPSVPGDKPSSAIIFHM